MASPLIPTFITGFSKGFQNNKKPFLLPDQAWAVLENAYCWRERILKREGLWLLGRLRRVFTSQPLGSSNSTLITQFSLESTATIEVGSVVITDSGGNTFTDQGNGTLTGVPSGSGTINYATTAYVLTGAVAPLTISFNYFPGLPVMGIATLDNATLNSPTNVWFDTKYAYSWNGTAFQEFIPGTTWAGTDSDFFWSYNYQGLTVANRLLFTTNFVNDAADPIRYTDGSTWTTFQPVLTNAGGAGETRLYQARIIIAYYGRLLLMNTWEGTTTGGNAGATNYFNRCRFSQLGSPITSDAWYTDVFGKGGSIDAPTDEQIIGAEFIKNTLVVTFQTTTWQLRYVGEYGLPFIWERVSVDFGSDSTFSTVLFDNQMLSVGNYAITAANGSGVQRIDLDIPDEVFNFQTSNNGLKRIFGIRDYQRELVFWNYADGQTQSAPGLATRYPNKVIVYNYRNNTYAIFRDNITCFGRFQPPIGVTWDNTNVTWDDEEVTWDDPDTQPDFPYIVSGNQQGFVHYYGYRTPDDQSLQITAVNLSVSPIQLTIPNHNLQNGEVIYVQNMLFVNSSTFAPVATDLNDNIYGIEVVDANTITIFKWDFTNSNYDGNFTFTPAPATSLYIGGGVISLFPLLNLQSKDINLFQSKGLMTKLSYLDFLMGATTDASMTVRLFVNSSPAVQGNFLVKSSTPNQFIENMSTSLIPTFYPPASDYAWFRFYATLFAQYFRINLTYSTALMNTLSTHQQNWVLYAINAFSKPGGRLVL